ncbi:MAG: hypothetical protein ACI9LO_000989 [Planctomycetota bacterium]|jgi:uncharacterized membrane protein
MSDAEERDLYLITEANEEFIIEWLNDRKEFHKWFTSLIIGTFVLLTIFGNKPGFASIAPVFLTSAVVLMLLALLCNLVCV